MPDSPTRGRILTLAMLPCQGKAVRMAAKGGIAGGVVGYLISHFIPPIPFFPPVPAGLTVIAAGVGAAAGGAVGVASCAVDKIVEAGAAPALR